MPKKRGTAKKYYKIPVPIKPHLLKFATVLYGEQIRIDRSTALGIFIYNSIEKKNYNDRKLGHGCKYDKLTATLEVFAEPWIFTKIGHDLSNENILAVNKFLENCFYEALYVYCKIFTKQDNLRYKGYTEAYEQFCNSFGIEIGTDIEYDAIRRQHDRYRTKMKTVQPLIPVTPELF